MQVKKFEARSMKEALEMVKTQLGPDAIILGVRDNKRSFGLVGEGSVEITAAVSDETLHKKKFAESRLREEDRQKLLQSTARAQKEFINRSLDNYARDQRKEKAPPRPLTQTRYIEIDDEMEGISLIGDPASERIRGAAQRAWNAMNVHGAWTEPHTEPAPKNTANSLASFIKPQPSVSPANDEIQTLKGEIASLRNVIRQFQNVPQTVVAPAAAPALTRHPGAEFGLGFEMSAMFEKLTNAGIAQDIAVDILNTAQTKMPPIKAKNKALIDAWVAKYILDTTTVVNEKNPAKVQVFLGPAGSGKTSSLIKLASHLVVHAHKKIALVTTDTFKVGAAEQLRIYAQILNVPFAMVRSAADWTGLMSQLAQFDHILVDTPGFSLKSVEENSYLRNILPPSSLSASLHLVLETTAKDADISEMGRRYKGHGFQDVIFTRLDQSIQHGTIYNFMRRFEVPLHSFGIGSRVPEDFEMATKERVLDLIFKLTNLSNTKRT